MKDTARHLLPLALLPVLLAAGPATQPDMSGMPHGGVAPVAPGQTGPMALPAGHPKKGDGGKMPTMNAPETGKVVLQLQPGSKGSPIPTNTPVTLQLIHRGAIVKELKSTLDAKGHAVFEKLPVNPPLRPLIILQHAGIEQRGLGPQLDATNQTITMDMQVFATTAQAPAWTVGMRHVMLGAVSDGMRVSDGVGVKNPTDRVWTGTAQSGGFTANIGLPLPPGAFAWSFDNGWNNATARVAGGTVWNTLPLFPETTQFVMYYTLPVKDGATMLTLTAPVSTEQLMIALPANAIAVSPEGLDAMPEVDMGPDNGGKVRMYRAGPLKAGQSVSLKLSGIVLPAAATQPKSE